MTGVNCDLVLVTLLTDVDCTVQVATGSVSPIQSSDCIENGENVLSLFCSKDAFPGTMALGLRHLHCIVQTTVTGGLPA
jgi:hypothetical protein